MKLADLFKFSTDNLMRRKGRTVLTVIGVVVGVCAIIVMISLGIAVNIASEEMLRSYGDLTKITVNRYGAQQGTPDLDDKMVAQFKTIPNVVAATPLYRSQNVYGQLYAGKGDRYQFVSQPPMGMDAESIPNMGYNLLVGNYITGQPFSKGKIPVIVEKNAMFGFADTKKNPNNPNYMKYPDYDYETGIIRNAPVYDESGNLVNKDDFFFDIMKTKLVYKVMYDQDSETGQEKYLEYELVVVGVFDCKSDYDLYSGIVMSIEDMQKIEKEYKQKNKSGNSNNYGGYYGGYGGYGSGEGKVDVKGYDNVYVKVDDVDNMPKVEKAIKDIGYQIYSLSDLRKQMQKQIFQTQMMLGGLAAISLFVAALNIANTMTMAIYERTKEIGVMKVLGCKLANIRQIFLIESGAIGFLGGLAGVALSLLISVLLNYMPLLLAMLGIESEGGSGGMMGIASAMPGAKVSVVPVWLIIVGLAFATLVGLLSGIAPANRAVKISSLEAIRHE